MNKETIKEHLGYLAIIWSIIKWMLVATVFVMGIVIALQNFPLYFAWGWMITTVLFLLWTRQFFS